MQYLNGMNFQQTLMHLRVAEKLVNNVQDQGRIHKDDRSKLMALTLNNLGCYYKRINKPNVSLRYMSSALKEEIKSR